MFYSLFSEKKYILLTTLFSLLLQSVAANAIDIKAVHPDQTNEIGLKFFKTLEINLNKHFPKEIIQMQYSPYDVAKPFFDQQLNYDIAVLQLSDIEKISKRFKIIGFPFTFNSYSSSIKFVDSPLSNRLMQLLEIKNISGLGYLHRGMKLLYINEPNVSIKNISGKKICSNSSGIRELLLKVLSVKTIIADNGSIEQCYLKNSANGVEDTWEGLSRLNEFNKTSSTIIESNHLYDGMVVVVKKLFIDALDFGEREVFEFNVLESIASINKQTLAVISETRNSALKNNLISIKNLDKADRDFLILKLDPFLKNYDDEIGESLISNVQNSKWQ